MSDSAFEVEALQQAKSLRARRTEVLRSRYLKIRDSDPELSIAAVARRLGVPSSTAQGWEVLRKNR